MNRCTVIDRLEDEYGIKPESLTNREKAIIGLCTNQFLGNEEQALTTPNQGQSEQLCQTCNGSKKLHDKVFGIEIECPDC
jgi:hypothetical protein